MDIMTTLRYVLRAHSRDHGRRPKLIAVSEDAAMEFARYERDAQRFSDARLKDPHITPMFFNGVPVRIEAIVERAEARNA